MSTDIYRLNKPLQPGDKVRVLPNSWGIAEAGDTGTLRYQHYTMIGHMVPAGWIVQISWRWTPMRIICLFFDLVLFNWRHLNCCHLFDNDFEVIEDG